MAISEQELFKKYRKNMLIDSRTTTKEDGYTDVSRYLHAGSYRIIGHLDAGCVDKLLWHMQNNQYRQRKPE